MSERCGVPSQVARVGIAEVLAVDRPDLARQVRQPGAVLLPPALRPARLPRPYKRVGPGYAQLVNRACAAGLQKAKPKSQVAKHRGRVVENGSFAVPKTLTEDR